MPIFEYQCVNCGKQFEELVMKDQKPACPVCGSIETEKLMSRCARCRSDNYNDYSSYTPSGGGCAGCSGGNCASCGN